MQPQITYKRYPDKLMHRGYVIAYKYIGYNEHHVIDIVVYNIR